MAATVEQLPKNEFGLRDACQDLNYIQIQKLLQAGANPNVTFRYGYRPIHHLFGSINEDQTDLNTFKECFKTLITSGADVTLRTDNDDDCLKILLQEYHWYSRKNKVNQEFVTNYIWLVDQLTSMGLDLNRNSGETPFSEFCYTNMKRSKEYYYQILEHLLKKGADPNILHISDKPVKYSGFALFCSINRDNDIRKELELFAKYNTDFNQLLADVYKPYVINYAIDKYKSFNRLREKDPELYNEHIRIFNKYMMSKDLSDRLIDLPKKSKDDDNDTSSQASDASSVGYE